MMAPVIDCGRMQLVFRPHPCAANLRTGAFDVSYDGEQIGSVSLVETAPRHAVIGYEIADGFRGQGLASRAVAAVLAAAPTFGLATVSAQCRSNNAPSRRILEKSGFTLRSSSPFWTNTTLQAGKSDASLLYMVYQWFAAPSCDSRLT